eukprot:360018-Chlamydomonas_euryale.AAC.4
MHPHLQLWQACARLPAPRAADLPLHGAPAGMRTTVHTCSSRRLARASGSRRAAPRLARTALSLNGSAHLHTWRGRGVTRTHMAT